MRIIQWITLFAGVSIVSATWPDTTKYYGGDATKLPDNPQDLDVAKFSNLPDGQVDGAHEIKALSSLRQFAFETEDMYKADKLASPPWTKSLKVLPTLQGGNLKGFVPISNANVQAHLTANGYVQSAGKNTWESSKVKAAKEIVGTYWGIPVQRTGTGRNIGYRSVTGSVGAKGQRIMGHADTIKSIADTLKYAASLKGDNAWSSAMKFSSPAMKSTLETFHREMDTITWVRFREAGGSVSKDPSGTWTYNIPTQDPNASTKEEITANGHIVTARAFLKTTSTLSTMSNYPEQIVYSNACSAITKRYLFGRRLAKRADRCMPEDIQVVGDDSMGVSSMTTDDQLRAEVNSLRGVKALTGNQKILPNDMGEGFTVDPADSTELDPSSVMEGALTGDEAWEAVEGSFNDILDNAPETVDRSLTSKVMKTLKKNAQARIQALKEVPFGAPTDKIITAEARKMALERMAAKYLNTYGNHYQKDDTDDPDAEDLDPDALEISMEMPFHDIDYRNLADLKDIAEGNLIDDVAALDSSVGGLEKSPTENDGGLDYFRPELAVAGTTEYSKLWGFLGDKIDAVLKDPKTPKWKLLRARAMLSRAQKSIEVRNKELQNKQKEGGEITQLDIDEYDAMHEFYGKVSDSLVDKDIDSMPDTAEDKANPLPEFSRDPGMIPKLSPRTTFKTQKGKPMGWRGGIRAIADANRRWNHATRPFSVGGNKKN
ncbi:hypothetical protein K457DRAFT_143541 [Linnemannia elongata AG-77]|uniref:Uncharacterized protein n=1 Tax=Linnemannia elongata AG-77 TaxID=1314771 RepID=A0A197JAY1_9FUNG|nr:hypothetical protein K457DRAFT_143541 [Linnemannia elongata AG-77]